MSAAPRPGQLGAGVGRQPRGSSRLGPQAGASGRRDGAVYSQHSAPELTPSSPRPVLSSGALQRLDPGAALPGGLRNAGGVGALGSLPEGHQAGPLAPGSRRGESGPKTCLSLPASLPPFCFFLPFFTHNS